MICAACQQGQYELGRGCDNPACMMHPRWRDKKTDRRGRPAKRKRQLSSVK